MKELNEAQDLAAKAFSKYFSAYDTKDEVDEKMRTLVKATVLVLSVLRFEDDETSADDIFDKADEITDFLLDWRERMVANTLIKEWSEDAEIQ